ncbi:MAG TPA: hypothetical protein PKL29_04000 [Methanothrix sp.]|nr:hypothetical protein [Methanothrix sp.]HPS91014.1 hypothetical protein [Methanothrix sp.]
MYDRSNYMNFCTGQIPFAHLPGWPGYACEKRHAIQERRRPELAKLQEQAIEVP